MSQSVKLILIETFTTAVSSKIFYSLLSTFVQLGPYDVLKFKLKYLSLELFQTKLVRED